MADKHAVDPAGGIERLDVPVGHGPIETTTWKSPPPPDPCACPVAAIHRMGINETPGGARLASLPPGNAVLPPLAQLYLPPGSYVVSANFSVTSNLGAGGIVFAMLGTRSQGSMSWTWLRMPPHGSPGDSQIVHLQAVVTLTAAEWVSADAYGGAQNYAFLAYDIWLIAQRTGIATVQTV